MSDLISRQDVIDEICMDWCGVHHKDCTHQFGISHDDYYYCEGCGDVETIKALPSAEPERKTGKWIKPTGMMPPEYHGHYECSECGAWAMCTYHKSKVKLTRYCPGCGEKVRYSEGELCEAFDMAIEALDDKIPRKLEKKEDMFGMSYHLYCPACGRFFGEKGKRTIWLGEKPAYCDCGQRLDWSDVDDNIPK